MAVGAGARAFITLHTLLLDSKVPERSEEYCVALLNNARNPAIATIWLLTALSGAAARQGLLDGCRMNPLLLRERVRPVARFKADADLTYAALLMHASAAVSTAKLQVVAHADIILGTWPAQLQGSLRTMHHYRMVFALSRTEPKRCLAGLDHRTRVSGAGPQTITPCP